MPNTKPFTEAFRAVRHTVGYNDEDGTEYVKTPIYHLRVGDTVIVTNGVDKGAICRVTGIANEQNRHILRLTAIVRGSKPNWDKHTWEMVGPGPGFAVRLVPDFPTSPAERVKWAEEMSVILHETEHNMLPRETP